MSELLPKAILKALIGEEVSFASMVTNVNAHHIEPHATSLMIQQVPVSHASVKTYKPMIDPQNLSNILTIEAKGQEEFHFKDYLENIADTEVVYESINMEYITDEHGDATYNQFILMKRASGDSTQGVIVEASGCKEMAGNMSFFRSSDLTFITIDDMTKDMEALIVSGMKIAEIDSHLRNGMQVDLVDAVHSALHSNQDEDKHLEHYLLNKAIGKDLSALLFKSLNEDPVPPFMEPTISHIDYVVTEGELQVQVYPTDKEATQLMTNERVDRDALTGYVKRVQYMTGESNGTIRNPSYKPGLCQRIKAGSVQ